MLKKTLLCGCVLCICLCSYAQRQLSDSILTLMLSTTGFRQIEEIIDVEIEGRVFSALIEDGDTIIVADLVNVNVSSPKRFADRTEYYRYMKYRRYAASIFPYAQEAVRIFKEAEYSTHGMKKRKRKKHNRKLAKQLKKQFGKPLKKMSKTQGKILIKMIERELGRSMYHLIKNTNGWWKAMYWNSTSRFFGYKLKEGYSYGVDPILDVVLMDFDL
ncbi:MAG: DUF4294 domain-containing protein [Saprospiraceae bacterium]